MKANNAQTQLPIKRFQTWIKSTKLEMVEKSMRWTEEQMTWRI